MFGLPSHDILLIKKDGTKVNVMSVDCSTRQEVKDEVEYLFNKHGYKKEEYIKVQYTYKNKVLYEYDI